MMHNVLDFGAIVDGVADDTEAVQSAHDSLGISGGVIFFPAGVYLIGSVVISKQCLILGAGMSTGGSCIKPRDAASDVLKFIGSSISVRDMAFAFAPPQTGGAFIHCDAASSAISIENIVMHGWKTGILIDSIADVSLRHVRLRTGVPMTGTGVRVNSGLQITMSDVCVSNAPGLEAGMGLSVATCGDITMFGCQWLTCVNGMAVHPGAGQTAASIYAEKCYFDNNTNNGLIVLPQHATATVTRGTFSNCWFGSSGNSGICLDSASLGGSIDGFTFSDSEAYLNGSHGVVLSGAGTARTRITGCKIAQNNGAGLLAGAGVSNWQVSNNTIGPIGSLAGNATHAIQSLAGSSNDVLICDNQLTGNGAAPMNIASTGARRRIASNHGYNPVGTSPIQVTASPFRFTARDTPTDIFITGGVVSLIKVNSVGVLQSTNHTIHLEPGDEMEVTYSYLPKMVKNIH
ncbi:MAG: right-handed parallel beta-helix repeat-containing protein [Rhizobiales bacterium]|nr:right-handed parallel beta-helix repeat-containing protein [Hyphomicrobiales bacterium]